MKIVLYHQRAGEELVYHGVSVKIQGDPASANLASGLAGDQLFIDSSNTQDTLTTLMRFRDVMNDFDGTEVSKDRLASVVADTITNLGSSQEAISEAVTKIGARVNTLESTKDQHIDTTLVSNEILSDLRDLDYAEAASRLSAQTLVLEAAQASFVRISALNLFDRL